MRHNGGAIVANVIKWGFILLMVIFTLYPVVYTLLGSVKTNMELTMGGSFLPRQWMFSNYAEAFQKAQFFKYTINSVWLSIMVTVIALATSSVMGYVLARMEFPGRKIIQTLYLAFMFVSLGAVSLYPQYKLVNALGLTKGLLGLAFVITGSQATNIFLTMSFVKTLPKELDEAALIDGCNQWQVFGKIIFPLLMPILGVVALFAFRSAWNDYITAMVFTMSNPDLRTLTVAVVNLRYSANAAAEWNIMTAGASIALLPMLLIYIFTNRQFISGLTAGAVKG
jgi:raffinose/stachyose/melibiose transport system permease protein